ncbi:hypothetical protein ASF37_05165 [Aeromicrobium sp. Leaf289]|nr:hypothetical protein ASF37_05165 [Aeromicrobium sp. Leaf289]
MPKKVYVCKYVGTPGVDEELQTGQNPIEVSVNALDDGFPGTFPWSFTDAQGRSVAIGYVGDGLPVLTIEDCTPDVTDPEPLAATPQFATAPTCPTDGGMPRALFVLDGLFTAVITPTVGVIATFTEGDGITGPWELTFTPADGYTLVDDEGDPLESPYVVSGNAGVAADCDEIVVVDPEPTGVTPAFTTEPTCAVDDAVSALVAIDGLNRVSVVPTAGVVAQFTQGDGLTGPWTLEFTPVEGFELVDGEGDPLGVPYVVSGDAGVAADCDEIVVVDPGGDPDPDEPTEETGTSGDDETGTAGISDAGGTLPNAGGTSLWLLAAGAMLTLAGMTVLRRGSRSDDAAPTSVAVGHVAMAGPPPSAALPALVAPASLTSRAAPRRVLRRRDLAWLGAAVAIALGIGVRRQRA